ncbi:HNH endonuclease signature motif containing protein [Brachybacterium sp. GPGPB12]|uniref:HNH endonuclease signature motif containing protein n=1 Tax=Brachybacterium sp. GPGPB12 TaxID=3023517 RepID=UPI00313432EB
MIHTMTSDLSTAPSKVAVDLRLSLHSLTLSLLRRELRVHTISARIQRISLRRKTRLKILESHERSVTVNWTEYPTTRRTSRAQQVTWERAVKARDKHCQIRGPRCTGHVDEADHIIPVAEGGAELDPNNGQGACTSRHGDKTQAEARRGQHRWKRKTEPHPGLK